MEAKIDLRKIQRAWDMMSEKITFRGQERCRNRLFDELFVQWSAENMNQLKKRLGDQYAGVPNGLREHTITADAEKVTEPISKELVITWLKSHH